MFSKDIWRVFSFNCWIILMVLASSSSGQESVQNFQKQISQAETRLRNEVTEFYNMISTYSIGHSRTTHSSVYKRGCGLTSVYPPQRISDHPSNGPEIASIESGEDAFTYSWPWMVALFKDSAQGWYCGGVLINSNTILTAAHCVENMTAEEIKPVLGAHTLIAKPNLYNYRPVSSIHRHPNYRDCCKDDVAILKLAKPVVYGPKINRVCLPFTPFPASKQSQLINKTVTVIGWGVTKPEKNRPTNYIQRLQQGNLTLFDDSRCHRDHGNLFHSATEFCAGDYQNQTDTKKGDSGGPLLMKSSASGERWTVLGLTSYKRDDTKKSTGVYVKLSAFKDFIEAHM